MLLRPSVSVPCAAKITSPARSAAAPPLSKVTVWAPTFNSVASAPTVRLPPSNKLPAPKALSLSTPICVALGSTPVVVEPVTTRFCALMSTAPRRPPVPAARLMIPSSFKLSEPTPVVSMDNTPASCGRFLPSVKNSAPRTSAYSDRSRTCAPVSTCMPCQLASRGALVRLSVRYPGATRTPSWRV